MDRRRLLCGAAGLLAGVGLAGCTGSQGEVPVTAEPPPPGVGGDGASGDGSSGGDSGAGQVTPGRTVSIEDFDAVEADDGSLVVTITVSNDSERRQVRLVRATVTIEGVDTVSEQFVAVEGGGTVTVRLPVDVGYRAWLDGGSYVPQILDRTPATPLPTATSTPTSTETTTQSGGGGSPTRTPDADTRSETGTGTGTPSDATTDVGTGTTGTE